MLLVEPLRIKRFVERNEGRVARMAVRSLALRAYLHEGVRRVVRPVVPKRVPVRWAFLVGCYNSGTTVFKDLISAHPEIRTLPVEGARLTSVLPMPEDFGWNRMWTRCEERMTPQTGPEGAERIIRDWSPWWGRGGTVFLEKSIANGARIPWLAANFDDAYFIGLTRDGYCVSEGIRRRARPRGAAEKAGPRYPLSACAGQWVAANEKLMEASKKTARFKLISYERLVESPAEVLTEVWRFLGLDPAPVLEKDGAVEVRGRRFPLRDMNPESLSRLSPKDVEELTQILAPMQTRLGYERLPPCATG